MLLDSAHSKMIFVLFQNILKKYNISKLYLTPVKRWTEFLFLLYILTEKSHFHFNMYCSV